MTETIGQQLKRARLAKNLAIDQVVQATRIRAQAIASLEADDFESLHSAAQVRGFLKLYASFLGLSLEDMLAIQRGTQSSDSADVSPATPSPFPVREDDEPPTSPGEGSPHLRRRSVQKKPERISHSQSKKNHQVRPSGTSETSTGASSQGIEVLPHSRSDFRPETTPSSTSDVESIEMPVSGPVSGQEVSRTDQGATKRSRRKMKISSPNDPGGASQEGVLQQVLPSQGIFNTIGGNLQRRRESLSLSLDEIERHTHIRRHYLEALENGQFERLPSSVQTRGMLNNYGHFLDMDVDALLLEFAEGLQIQLRERQPRTGTESESLPGPSSKINVPVSLSRILSPDILVGGGVLVLLVLFAIWGTGRIISLSTAVTPMPTAPSISDILLSSPAADDSIPTGTSSPEVSTITAESGATQEITLPAAGDYPVQVVLVAVRSAWVRVLVDNVVEYEGRVTAGTAYPYGAQSQIEIVTGDGSAISIIYNQTNLGALGGFGEVVDRIYTSTAILLPTVTFTPSPTTTLTATITLRPSPTPRPSNTPRLTATPMP